jgi:MoxR-like ATPase
MKQKLHAVMAQASEIILGKPAQIRLALACLLARGHLLIEDLPGVGKTTLAHVLAQSLGLGFNRIQFTSDLLPGDILGVSIYQREKGEFHFLPGAVFAQVILADEINRATPKTQSALLEAMEEHQVTTEGTTRPLPEPFFVIATQNPAYQLGTFPLPESQLDRFLMRIQLGYPDRAAERELLAGNDRRVLLRNISPRISADELLQAQGLVSQVHVSAPLLDYVQALLSFSREAPYFTNGLSPRAGLALLQSARAMAFIDGRDFVIPEDVTTVLGPVVDHRLSGAGDDTVNPVERFQAVALP